MFGVSGGAMNLYRILLRKMPAFSESEKYVIFFGVIIVISVAL